MIWVKDVRIGGLKARTWFDLKNPERIELMEILRITFFAGDLIKWS